MSNYSKSTNFATKDNLTPGDPLKIVRGTEIDTEFNNIATAIATKTDNASAAIAGGTINDTTIGATTASTGAFTTLAASGAVTLSGGTANGVAYLNGSKVVTSGSALTFDGTNLGIGAATPLKPLDISFAGTSGARRFLASYDDSVITIKGANASNDPEAIRITGDNIRFNTGTSGSGSEVGRFTSTGLGIGTSSPSFKLDVNGDAGITASESYLYFYSNYSIGNNSRVRMRAVGAGGGSGYGGDFRLSTRATNNSWNTDALVVDSSANVGIGTSSPAYKLSVSGVATTYATSGSIGLYDTVSGVAASRNWLIGNVAAGNYGELNFAVSSAAGGAPTNSKMTLDSSGNLGLGVTPSAWTTFKVMQLGNFGAIGGVDSTSMNMFANTFYDGAFKYINTASASRYRMDDGHSWFTAPSGTAGNAITFSQAMTLDSSGNLLVGTTSTTGERIQVIGTSGAGTMSVQVGANGNNGIGFRNDSGTSAGSITVNASTVAYNTSSDYRLKNTIAPMTGALAKVAQLKPVTYKWNADGSNGQGFIAHELAEVCPDAVTGEKDAVDAQGNPQYQGIDVSFLVATLTAAIKEQQAIIESLKARLDAANL